MILVLLALACVSTKTPLNAPGGDSATDEDTNEGEDTSARDDTGEGTELTGLAAYGVLGFDGYRVQYAEGLVPYELNTPLFSDYAFKQRAIQVPEGSSITYSGEDAVLDMPVGTRIFKSFLYPEDLRAPEEPLRIIETRVLTKTDEGWKAEPWVWNEDGTEATLAPSGATMEIDLVGLDGEDLEVHYLVPQKNQCIDCHELKSGEERAIVPIGPKARHLNRTFDYGEGVGVLNQLEHLASLGLLSGLPDLSEVPTETDARDLEGVDPHALDPETLDAAARDYLDINCAHCHNPNAAEGVSSQLFLDRGTAEPFDLGVCKRPGSAGSGTGGFTFDIVPGNHAESILWYRMHTETVGEMMPDLGRSVRHDQGVDLVAAWIDGLEGSCED